MVANNWSDKEAASFQAAATDPADRELALRVYTSRLIGGDPDLTMHGGGNTSVKLARPDLFGEQTDVIHIKGSGWDLATIEAPGLPAVRLAPLLKLRELEALSDEDMVNAQRCNLLDSTAPTPSVETLLHAYLPHRYVDHTHATAFLVLANLPDAEQAMAEIFGDRMAFVPYIMPGFALAKAAAEVYEKHPDVEGLLLANHGHFAFGADARESYDRIVEHTNLVERWVADRCGATPSFSAMARGAVPQEARRILPLLRGALGRSAARHAGSRDAAMPVFDVRCGPEAAAFFERDDLAELAAAGVGTPDHVIRTKGRPLVLDGGDDLSPASLDSAVDDYVSGYVDYFERNAADSGGKKMVAPNPTVAWIKGVGVVGMGANAKAAGIAADIAEQTIAVKACGQGCGGFAPIGEADLFDMEYWSLEQAKLGKRVAPPLEGKVAMVTGAGGAIGAAIARTFAAAGCELLLIDRAEEPLAAVQAELGGGHQILVADVTERSAAAAAAARCAESFGGVDILLSNAGAAWTGDMIDLEEADLRASFELNFFAHWALAQETARLFAQQGCGGQILVNVSKQAVNPGKGFGAYGLPKAAAMFLVKQLAVELGGAGVRVNGVNADRIRSGLVTEEFIAGRAAARGISPEGYMSGNLLGREVEARHVAQAFLHLALSERTTAHVFTVDGGNIEASLR